MRFLCFLALVTLCASVARAQSSPTPLPTPIVDPFDHYGNITWVNEMARLDNFAIAIQNDPQMIGYIVVYGSKTGCLGDAQRRAVRAKNYLMHRRGIEWNRVIWTDVGYLDEEEVYLWGQTRGAEPYPFFHPISVPLSQVKLKRCSVRSLRTR